MLEEGQVIEGKYKIVRLIGVGGMGAVYEGENTRIRRRVAIKVLHAAAAANSDAVERFEREAQAAGRIGSDHILEVIDLGTLPDGDHFMVMEYLDGETLGARIKGFGRLSPQQAIPLLRQALLGLGAAHSAGIVHRDLKPENIFICREKAGVPDFVKIIDFGVSKFHNVGGGAEAMSMTRTGAVMGTPYYMSPEQAKGSRDIDHRSDLYSMGVILYESLTGHVPFSAETFNELLFKIVLSEPIPLREVLPDIDPAFESITLKAMSRDPAHRFQSSDEFIAALDRWLQYGAPVTIPPAVGHEAPGESEVIPQIPEPARVPAIDGVAQPGGGSVSAWASSQSGSLPKRSGMSPILIAAGALFGVLLVAGGAFAVWRVTRGGSADEATDTAAQVSESAAVESASATPPSPPPTPAETAEQPPEQPEKDEPPPEADTPTEAATAKSAPTTASKTASTSHKTPIKTATPKTGPTATTAPTATTKRPDFGY